MSTKSSIAIQESDLTDVSATDINNEAPHFL